MMQYFKKYDTDNNKMLDGLELLNAIMRMEEDDHHHGHHGDDDKGQDGAGATPKPPPTVEEISGYVDEILDEDDKDKDTGKDAEVKKEGKLRVPQQFPEYIFDQFMFHCCYSILF